MSNCTENFLIWTLVIAAILCQTGFGKMPLLLFVLPIALIAACVITWLSPTQNKLTVSAKSGSLDKQ